MLTITHILVIPVDDYSYPCNSCRYLISLYKKNMPLYFLQTVMLDVVSIFDNDFIIRSPEPKAPRWVFSIPLTPASLVLPSVNIFKHLLLWNHRANQTQISYGDSLGWGNESLFKWSWSHDQDGSHAHIW